MKSQRNRIEYVTRPAVLPGTPRASTALLKGSSVPTTSVSGRPTAATEKMTVETGLMRTPLSARTSAVIRSTSSSAQTTSASLTSTSATGSTIVGMVATRTTLHGVSRY